MFSNKNKDSSKAHVKTYKDGQIISCKTPTEILNSFKYQAVIKQISGLTGLSTEMFNSTYLKLIYDFANLAQLLPRQSNGALGGIISEGLARAALSFQKEPTAVYSPLQKFALFSAALLIDISKILFNHFIIICDSNGNYIREWNPFNGPMKLTSDEFYKIYPKQNLYLRLQKPTNTLLARQVMPKDAFLWISSDFSIYTQWLDALNEDESGGGGIKHSISLIMPDEIEELLESIGQLSEPTITSNENESGEAFYRWLRDGIQNDSIKVNAADSNVHITEAGVFIDDKIIKQFKDLSGITISLYAIKQQFGNLFGIAKKSGNDESTAMFFGESEADTSLASGTTNKSKTFHTGTTLEQREILGLSGKENSTHARSRKPHQSLPQTEAQNNIITKQSNNPSTK
jgi:hypothetical protein